MQKQIENASNDVMDELNNRFKIIELNDLDNIITRIEKMKVTNNRDDDIINLVNSMNSLQVVPHNHKLDVILAGTKKQRNKVFARKYKSVNGKKSTLTKNQVDDIFNLMNALKEEDDGDDWDDVMDEIDQLGGGKKSKKVKKMKEMKGCAWTKKVKKMKGGAKKMSDKEYTKKLRAKIAKKKVAGKKKSKPKKKVSKK